MTGKPPVDLPNDDLALARYCSGAGQQRAMRDGIGGIDGNRGTLESV